MIGKWVPVALLAASTVLDGCVEEERVVYVRPAPLSPGAAEVVATAPGPDTVYVRGHWEWDGSRYVWAVSRLVRRPLPHAVWVEAHWQNSPQGWYWQAGHWAGGHKEKTPVAAAPAIIEESPPAAPANPAAPAASVPPAPTYLPPPPPANPPPPPVAPPAS